MDDRQPARTQDDSAHQNGAHQNSAEHNRAQDQEAARGGPTQPAGTAQPSTTALTAAAARAAHLVVDDEPRIFADPLAARLLGGRADELISYHTLHGTHPVLAGARVQVACRSRYTQDALARAVAAGVTQYVILGAGLDSFAYRGGLAGRLRVFEVDHPASQQAKRAALAAARIAVPGNAAFVPADLAADSLGRCLADAGFDAAAPAVFGWLGVTMYLTPDAIAETMSAVARCAPGSELIADYLLPEEARDEAGALYGRQVGQFSAERGEPWRSSFTPAQVTDLARRCGLGAARSISQRDTIPADLWQRTDALRPAALTALFHGSSACSRASRRTDEDMRAAADGPSMSGRMPRSAAWHRPASDGKANGSRSRASTGSSPAGRNALPSVNHGPVPWRHR